MSTYGSTATKKTGKDAIIERARRCFKLATEAESKQRDREKEDLMFQVPELQWDAASKAERIGNGLVPPRPMLSISKIDQPMQLVSNQMRAADLGINVHPVSEDADDETAEIYQGMYRHIEQDSRAGLARSWAFDRARACGRGAWRVLKAYDERGGHPLDQKLVIKRILRQEGVYFDPSAEEPDFSDGEWAFVASWMDKETFERKYPRKNEDGAAEPLAWADMAHQAPDWIDGDKILVAEYWYKEHETDDYETTVDGKTFHAERDIVTVHCCKLYGLDTLEEYEWEGRYIPLIPAIGVEEIPFDGERRWRGMVRPARDGQRLYNFAASTLVERMALEPKTPFIGYEGQFTDEKWKQANSRSFPYIEVAAKPDGAGGVLPIPQRAQIDGSGMSLAMMALQEADRFIQATTAVYDPSLGRASTKSNNESGKAILAQQQQTDAATSQYLDNFEKISLTYEAKVILDLIPKIYDRPGRIARILRGDDDKSEAVMLNAPFVIDPKTQRPMQAAEGDPKAKHYVLKDDGGYGVVVTVGKSFQTRLQEGSAVLGELLSAKPELFMLMGDLWLRYQDWPGADEMAKRMAKVREKQFPGLGEGEDGQVPPEQLQAQLEASKQQIQQMEMMLKQAAEELKTEQAKQQATIQKAQMDAQASLQKAEMDNATRVEITRQNNETKMAVEEMRAQMGRIAAALEHAHETNRSHEEMAHDVALTSLQQQQAAQQAEEQREHDAVMGTMPDEPTMPAGGGA